MEFRDERLFLLRAKWLGGVSLSLRNLLAVKAPDDCVSYAPLWFATPLSPQPADFWDVLLLSVMLLLLAQGSLELIRSRECLLFPKLRPKH